MIQKSLSIIPGGRVCNRFLQEAGGALRNDEFLHRTFNDDITVLFERMAGMGLEPRTSRVFEIGTGWLPIFPLSLALCGFRNVTTVDLNRHLTPGTVRRTLLALRNHLDHPCLQVFSPLEEIFARFERLVQADHVLTEAGITYLAPCDATRTALQAGSLDLIVSNNVFEHVPQPVLTDMFREGKRTLSSGGHMLHCVNCGDHYAYADRSVSQVNYLRFSEKEWSRWNNPIHYQNRLRPIDFLSMADGAGLEIRSAEYTPNPAYMQQIADMEIAPEFRHYAPEQLAATSLTMIATC